MISQFRGFHPIVRIRLIILFISSLSSNAVIPFMAIYMVRYTSVGAATIALSLAILFNLLSSILGGYYGDRIGRKKMMVMAEALRTGAFFVMLIVNSPWLQQPYLMVLCFIVSNISSGLYGPASEALILDVTEAKDRRTMYVYMYWISNLSVALGGVLGTLLFDSYMFQLCSFMFLSSCLALFLTVRWIPETYVKQSLGREGKSNRVLGWGKELFGNYRRVLSDQTFVLYMVAVMLLFSLESHFNNYVAVRFEGNQSAYRLAPMDWQFGGVQLFGLLRIENTVLVVLFSILSVGLLKRWKERGWFYLGIVLFLAGYVGITFSNTPWLLVLLMVAAVFGEVMFAPIYETYLGNMTPEHLRSSYLAVNKMAIKGSMLLGALGVSLVNHLSPLLVSALFLFTGIVALIMIKLVLGRIDNQAEKLPIGGTTNENNIVC